MTNDSSLAYITAGLGLGGSLLAQAAAEPAGISASIVGALVGLVALVIRTWYLDRKDARSVESLRAAIAALELKNRELRDQLNHRGGRL